MRTSMAAVAGVFVSTASALSYETVSTVYEYYSNCLSTQAGLATALPVGIIHNSSFRTETYCESCADGTTIPFPTPAVAADAAGAAAAPGTNGTLTSPLTTYTTVYSCPGSAGLEEKTYTITEPCPTLGQPRSAGYIPQDFTVITVQCTACPGSPNVAVTQPATAAKTEAPLVGSPGAAGSAGSPSAAAGSPGSPGSAASPGSPGSPGAAASPGSAGSPSVAAAAPGSSQSAGSPGAVAGSPGSAPSAGSPGVAAGVAGSAASPAAAAIPGSAGSPGAAAAAGSPSVGAENGSGVTASLVAAASPASAGGPGAEAAPAAPGSSSPEPAAPGAPGAPGAASAPFPVSASGEARTEGTAAPSTGASSSSVTPFEGAAKEIFTISLSFLIGVGGFVGFYLIL